MKNNELFKTIERLKESLSEIESARQQVSVTVAAYSETQKEIDSYVANLNGIKSALNDLITLLQNHKAVIDQHASQAVASLSSSCEAIIADTKTKLNATADGFATASGVSITKMQAQQKLFDKTIEKASSLKNDISALTSSVKDLQFELASSQKQQDTAIANIASAQTSMSSQQSTTGTTINGIVSTLSKLTNSLHNVQTSVNTAQSQLEQKVASLGQNNEELKNKVSTLKLLLRVQIIISIATIVIMFILK